MFLQEFSFVLSTAYLRKFEFSVKSTRRTFLGKTTPTPHQLGATQRKPKFGSSWMLLFSAPVLLFLGLSLTTPLANGNQQGTTNQSSDVLRQVRVFGAASTTVKSCDEIDLKNVKLFPLIPDAIRNTAEGGCNPQSWNRRIFVFLAYKLLGVLNYLAGAIAIIATIFGGILYLTGFASEANIKKAKSVIVGAYIGFAIVLLARLLVQGSFYLFGDGSTDFSNSFEDTTGAPK